MEPMCNALTTRPHPDWDVVIVLKWMIKVELQQNAPTLRKLRYEISCASNAVGNCAWEDTSNWHCVLFHQGCHMYVSFLGPFEVRET